MLAIAFSLSVSASTNLTLLGTTPRSPWATFWQWRELFAPLSLGASGGTGLQVKAQQILRSPLTQIRLCPAIGALCRISGTPC